MSITMCSWARNTMLALSFLIILYFSRWRPIWPPNHTKSHISAQNHDTNLMLLPILTKIWSRNLMVTFSTFAKNFCKNFSRWRPIWPPNHTKSYISAHKHDRETNFVSINMYSWTRNTMVAFSILTILYFSRWRPIWPPNQTKSHISAEKHDRQTLCSAVKKVTLTVRWGL